MSTLERHETAAERLLYDDAAPRLRSAVGPVILRPRRPAFLMLPLAVLLTSGLIGAGIAWPASTALNLPAAVLAIGVGGYVAVTLSFALLLAKREEGFALVTASNVSLQHMLIALTACGAFVVGGPLGRLEVGAALALIPGPAPEGFGFRLAQAYVLAFIAVTVIGILGGILLRLIGLRRAVAAGD